MDTTPLIQAGTAALLTVATVAIPVATSYACSWLGAHKYGKFTSAIASTGGQIAYTGLAAAMAKGGTPDWGAAKAAAIAAAVPLVQMAETEATKAITNPDTIHALITAGLGKLLAADPTVPGGLASTALATDAKGGGAEAAAGGRA